MYFITISLSGPTPMGHRRRALRQIQKSLSLLSAAVIPDENLETAVAYVDMDEEDERVCPSVGLPAVAGRHGKSPSA